jgi:hypothetical protein
LHNLIFNFVRGAIKLIFKVEALEFDLEYRQCLIGVVNAQVFADEYLPVIQNVR